MFQLIRGGITDRPGSNNRAPLSTDSYSLYIMLFLKHVVNKLILLHAWLISSPPISHKRDHQCLNFPNFCTEFQRLFAIQCHYSNLKF